MIENAKRHYMENRESKIEYQKQWVQRNYEKVYALRRKYKAKTKAVEYNFTEKEWQTCKQYFNHECCYCGKSKVLEREHLIPLSKGGGFVRGNIVPACKSCNNSKYTHDWLEWFVGKDYYSKQREEKIKRFLMLPV